MCFAQINRVIIRTCVPLPEPGGPNKMALTPGAFPCFAAGAIALRSS